jgi:GTP-binding protein EngB required for normal cell division
MKKIDERKLQVLRNAISSLFGYSMELCDIRPELYSINREEWERDIENVRKQIGAKQVLLFIGPFSSGKSSFVNALLGEDILPTSNRPCTSVVTELTFVDGGGHKGIAVRKDGEKTDVEYDFYELLKMVDGPTGAIGESAAYHHIELQYDISQLSYESKCLQQLCDAGVTIVDCPGFGSPYYSNDEIIEEYISKASHTFWINPVDRMGSVADYKKLSEIRKKTTMLIPIMSKADLIDSESKMESIRDDYAETIGSLFRSKDPIFCSAIKYKQGMDIDKRIRKEKLSGVELENAINEMDILFRESGISSVFSAVIDSASEKQIAASKIYSVYHDLVDLTGNIKSATDRELKYWRRELKSKGWDDTRNCALEEARDSVSLWIEGEANRIGHQIDNEIKECIQNYVASCAKNINTHELQNQVISIWENKINGNVESWGRHIAAEYNNKIKLSIPTDGRRFDLPVWLTSSHVVNSMRDARDVIFSAVKDSGAATVIQGGFGATLLASMTALKSVAVVGGVLSTTAGIVGGALLAVAAVGFIPVYSRYSKQKKEQQRREMEGRINKWLESLHMRDAVFGLLTSQNEDLFNRLEKEQQTVAEELIDNKNQCESIIRRLDEMLSVLQIQFANIK